MIAVTTKEWTFTAARTDFLLQAFASTEKGVVSYAQVTAANSNTVDVSVRIGFGTSTLPTMPVDSSTGVDGMVLSHGGIAKGGGAVVANGGAPITVGELDEDLRLTCSVPTGGSLRVVVAYRILDLS